MPLNKTTQSILSGRPYWDDFDASKRFHRVLTKPGFPVQVREFNQAQTITQHQIEKLTGGLFREGAAVAGGNPVYTGRLAVIPLIGDDSVDVAVFVNEETGEGAIIRGTVSGAEARVVTYDRNDDEGTVAVIVAMLTTNTFTAGEMASFVWNDGSTIATMVLGSDLTKTGAVFSIDAGTFFLRGFLVDVPRQTVLLSSTTHLVTTRIGFEIIEDVVTSEIDPALLDPALGTTNYAAPGADRLRLTGFLTHRPIAGSTSTQQNADDDFIEIARVIDGVLLRTEERLRPDVVEDVLARRTFDASGDFVVRPFRLTVGDHDPSVSVPNATGRISGNATSNVVISAHPTIDTEFDVDAAVDDEIVVNGERRTVTSIINAIALTVNSAFSSVFSNTTFSVASPDKLTLELDAGKAYVRGYEYETLGVSKLEVPRPRDTANATALDTSTFFGPYVYVTRDTGLFSINTHEQVDLHNVPFASINTAANTYVATKIGTAHVRSMTHHFGAVGGNTTVYKLYLVNATFTPKTYTITASANSDSSLTGMTTATNTSGHFVTLTHNASSTGRSLLATANLSFVGARLTLLTNDGASVTYPVVNSVSGNTSTTSWWNQLQLQTGALLTSINTSANVVVSFSDRSIRGVSESVALAKGVSVSNTSKEGQVSNGATIVWGTDSSSLLFPFNHQWVKADSISGESFEGILHLEGAGHVTRAVENASHTVFTLTTGSADVQFYPTVTPTATYFVVANSAGSMVSMTPTTTSAVLQSNTSEVKLFIPTTNVATGLISAYARVIVNTANPRTKSLIVANTSTANVVITSGNVVSNLSTGHIGINTINAASSRIVGLGVADVYELKKVYGITGVNTTPVFTDVTNRYTLDNGQRHWAYDHASIVLKPGSSHPLTERMVVMVDRFSHSSSNGFFTAESYTPDVDYADIPSFTDPKTGRRVELRDMIDFRPIRTANTTLASVAADPNASTPVMDTQMVPFPDGTFESSYEYYLPRIDKVVVLKSKELRVLVGTSAVQPLSPPDPQDGITLYTLSYPPYTTTPSVVQVQAFDYRRYTMKDIGKLEKRIEHLEYYVGLNALEQQTLNTPEFDGDQLERYKNGILVEPFMSFAVADVANPDFKAAIDTTAQEMRPSLVSTHWALPILDTATSTNYRKTGTMVTVDYTTTPFITQPLASKRVNVNPFNVVSWTGNVRLTPSSDTWFDTERLPSVTVNLFGENDNWTSGETRAVGMTWGAWETNWFGVPQVTEETLDVFAGWVDGDPDPRQQWIRTVETTSTQSQSQVRQGLQTMVRASDVWQEMGDRIVNVAVAPYIRASVVAFDATGLRPGATVVATFDEQDVTGLVERANEIRVASNTVAQTFAIGEVLSSNASPSGTATVVGITGNVLRVVNTSGLFYRSTPAITITGATSGATATVSEYISASGRVTSAPSGTSVELDAGASATSDVYNNNVIYITSGIGAGTRSTITDYDGVTKIATISPALATAANATYSIGTITADGTPTSIALQVEQDSEYFTGVPAAQQPGRVFGLFRIPSGRFLTGRRIFRLADQASNETSTTRAEGLYEATGHTTVVEGLTVGTRLWDFTTIATSDTRTISTTTSQTNLVPTGEYLDPLAQTFLIERSRFPQGVMVTDVDLFFAKKDPNNLPVTVQIRPTVNGFPSADIILAQAARDANDVVVIPTGVTPTASTTGHATRFTFERPVFLAPSMEYAIVVLSNSSEYEVFVAEIGQPIIGDTRIISEQPYGGSFFKSQNARTWTPEQNEDLMFVLRRAVFDTDAATIGFKMSDLPLTDVNYDVVNIQTGRVEFPATADATNHRLYSVNVQSLGQITTGTTLTDVTLPLSQRKRVLTGNVNSLKLAADVQTTSDAVSPLYDTERVSITTIENVIDNGGLYANGFVVTQSVLASGGANTYEMTITGDGTSAVAQAVTNSSGAITHITMVVPGEGYTVTPTVTFTANTNFSVQPVITYRGETSPKCEIVGEQTARYITRRVTLADGFDANDIKVYLAASRPTGTNVDVYYRTSATGDVVAFEDKSWTKMVLDSDQAGLYTSGGRRIRDYIYTTENSSTNERFHTFAIKVVLRSPSTTIVPIVRNLRIIALDE